MAAVAIERTACPIRTRGLAPGCLLLTFGAVDPERVSKLVLMGMPVGFTPHLPLPVRVIFGAPVLPHLFMRRAATMEGQRKQYQQLFKTDPDSLPELYFRTRIVGVKRPRAQQTWATLLGRVTRLRGYRPGIYLGDELSRISQPTLVIWGEHDWVPVEEARAAAARMPDARVHYLTRVGHFPFLQATEETACITRNFVASTTPATSVA